MTCEQYWLRQRETFLKEAGQTQSDSELLTLYQRMLEQMKANAVYPAIITMKRCANC